MTCDRCPAWLFSPASTASGLCAGCRAGPPQMTVTEARPDELLLAMAGRVAAQAELLSRKAEDPRPWWVQAASKEGGCPL